MAQVRMVTQVALLAVALGVGAGAHAQRRGAPKARKAPVKKAKPTRGKPAGKTASGAKPDKLETALANLSSKDVATAERAAWSLGFYKREARALDQLLDALALGLHPRVARAALLSLARLGLPKSFGVARFYLHYRDPKVRAAAVTAVGALEHPQATKLVLAALHDGDKSVRAAAAKVVADRKIRQGIAALLELMKKGDEATARATAAFATTDMARAVGELIGSAPDALVARALGLILLNPKFGPEGARVQVVKTLAKVPGNTAVEQLTAYIESVPAKPPRQSRRMAEAVIEQRLTGGK